MPDPREAVYDVLLAKKRRADEARAVEAERERRAKAVAEGEAAFHEVFGQTFEEWNRANERARAAARSRG